MLPLLAFLASPTWGWWLMDCGVEERSRLFCVLLRDVPSPVWNPDWHTETFSYRAPMVFSQYANIRFAWMYYYPIVLSPPPLTIAGNSLIQIVCVMFWGVVEILVNIQLTVLHKYHCMWLFLCCMATALLFLCCCVSISVLLNIQPMGICTYFTRWFIRRNLYVVFRTTTYDY